MKWTSHLAQGWTKIPGAQHSDEAKAYYKEILKLFISLDDYENNTISDMLNSVGIHLEQEQEESLLAGDATYDE